MNANVAGIRSMLESRLQAGRSPIEAAGEILWRQEFQLDTGLFSIDTAKDAQAVVLAWLEEKLDGIGPVEQLALKGYLAHLNEHVERSSPTAADDIDRAWTLWGSR